MDRRGSLPKGRTNGAPGPLGASGNQHCPASAPVPSACVPPSHTNAAKPGRSATLVGVKYLRPFLLRLFLLAVAGGAVVTFSESAGPARADENPTDMIVEQDPLTGGQFVYVVFHALDRDGFCAPVNGSVSRHPVLDIPVDFVIESGDGIIIETSGGSTTPGRPATGVRTFSTYLNAQSANPVRSFPPLVDGLTDECQAWVKISQSIPGPLRVLVTLAGDDGKPIGFIADLDRTATVPVSLTFRWSLVTWAGKDGITPADALRGPAGGNDITGEVTALYGWDAPTQSWRAYFPGSAGVPGANDLAALKAGQAYWVAIKGPGPVAWNIPAE